MYKLPQGAQIREVAEASKPQYKTDPKSIRPEVVDAKVYKLRAFGLFLRALFLAPTKSSLTI